MIHIHTYSTHEYTCIHQHTHTQYTQIQVADLKKATKEGDDASKEAAKAALKVALDELMAAKKAVEEAEDRVC